MFHLCVAVLQHDVTGYSYAGVLKGREKRKLKKKKKNVQSLDGTQKWTLERKWGGLAAVDGLLCDAAQTISVSVKTR